MNVPLPLLVIALAWIVLAVTLATLTLVPRYRAWRARGMARSVGLELDDSARPMVERALATRERGRLIGGTVGLALGLAAIAARPVHDDLDQWFTFAGCFIGIGVGTAVGAILARPRSPESGPRVARSREVTLGDYLTPLEHRGAQVLVLLAVVFALTAAVLVAGFEREQPRAVTTLVIAGFAVAALAARELIGRAVLAQRSPASDLSRLAWEDAQRADTLAQLTLAPLLLGGLGVVFAALTAFGALAPTLLSVVIGTAIPLVLIMGFIAVTAIWASRSPHRHFLRVLWPEIAVANGTMHRENEQR